MRNKHRTNFEHRVEFANIMNTFATMSEMIRITDRIEQEFSIIWKNK